jgi:uncharacterized protein YbaA (DUF1428 family)
MSYVDGFVIPVSKRKVAAYRKMAQWGKRVWMKAGAVEYFECVGDDFAPPMSGDFAAPTNGAFKKMAKLKPSETVFFSFIVYRNKAHRNAVNKQVMNAMSKQSKEKMPDMPFDVKRMAYGGFKTLVEAHSRR